MFAELLVTIIFKILNFVALIGLFIFIFKKYFRNEIEAAIEHDHLEEVNLNTRIKEIEQRGSELSEEIFKQEKLCEYLNARTSQWQIAFEKNTEQKQREQQELHRRATDRAKLQAQTIAYERTIQAVLPKALATACNKLKGSFEGSAGGKDLVKDILNHMKKSL